MTLSNIFLIGMGGCVIIFGSILMTRRVVIVRQSYFNLFLIMMIIIPRIILDAWAKELLFIYSSLLLILLSSFLFMEKYKIYNIDGKSALDMLVSVLDNEGISHKHIEDTILLENNNKSISFTLSPDMLDINFRKIRKMHYYKKIRREFFSRVKAIGRIQSSSSGPVYLILGILIILASTLLESTLS